MTEVLSRADLIRSGKAKEYIQKRKIFLAEECYLDQFLYDGGIHNHYVDRQTKEVLWNDLPRRPEYFGLSSIEEIKECEKIRQAVKKQVMRLKQHLLFMLAYPDYDCYFITITFTDDYLSNTDEKNRKRTVRTILSDLCEDFIANVDFAPETGREHYHGVIAVKLGEVTKIDGFTRFPRLDEAYRHGHISIKPIRHTKKSTKAVPRYIDKLALHAFKEHQSSIITKRGTPYQDYQKAEGGPSGVGIRDLQAIVSEKWRANGDPDAVVNKLLNIFGPDFEVIESM